MKAQADPMKVIIAFILLLVVAGIVIFIFKEQIGKQTDVADKQIGLVGDSDLDGVANFLDKCPDRPGLAEFRGCPSDPGSG